ncbi:hypothetical protein ACFXB3_09760 [Streptomyces sp. NPDC059447]|uniref:hypothetical protein n=1 Tax=Streptomyces sp. NPDC059447 TaxID=3346834 RepID=UPI0036BCB423
MICPNCSTSLKRTERTGQVCSHCHRRFALDPRLHGTGMHDVRIRRCAESLTDNGRLKVTVTQLWYRSRTQSSSWPAKKARGVHRGISWPVALAVCAGLIALAVRTGGAAAFWCGVGAVLVLVVPKLVPYERARSAGSSISPSEYAFRRLMSGEWTTTYGGLPPGVVDDADPAPGRAAKRPDRPRAVILCTDHAVATFLEANGMPRRLQVVLLEADPEYVHEEFADLGDLGDLADLPGGLPVVVVRDASALGVMLAPLLRIAHPDRTVVDAGLPVSAVRSRRGAVHRFSPAPAVEAEALRAVAGLSEEDAAWLAAGFWSPVAAVPPALLLSVVENAVARAVAATAPSGPAPEHGFLTWPDAPAMKGTSPA